MSEDRTAADEPRQSRRQRNRRIREIRVIKAARAEKRAAREAARQQATKERQAWRDALLGDAAGRHGFMVREGTPNTYVTTQQLVADTYSLIPLLPLDITAVAGVSRSGLMPAAIVATHLHLPLFSVCSSTMRVCGNGWRLRGLMETRRERPPERERILIVDDSMFHGRAMANAVCAVQESTPDAEIVTAVVYCHPKNLHRVDFISVGLPKPHIFEWNFLNSLLAEKSAFDLDGIFCRDIAKEDDDDGDRYRRALAEAVPIGFSRRAMIPVIITARLEKYREITEAWLVKHGIRVERLVMGPWANNEERGAAGEVARYKAAHFLDSGARMFVESSPGQAKTIFRLTGKAVFCPAAGKVFAGEKEFARGLL